MTSQYRHRRTSNPATAFPNPLEPGEIAVNTANRQIAIGDAQSGVIGAPLPAIAVRYFDIRGKYVANDFVQNGTSIFRANKATGPGAFVVADWEMMVGQFDPQYVAKAGDTMSGMLVLPATVPSIGTHATNKTYVDTGLAGKSTIYSATSPPAGVADNSMWFETDTGLLYVRYNDGSTSQWVIACPQPDISNFVLRSGDNMSGPLGIPLTPTLPAHATSKSYVDAQLAGKSSIIASDTPPVGAIDNSLWYETDSGATYVRYNDLNGGAQWVAIADPAGLVYAAPFDAMSYNGMQVNGSMEVSQELGAAGVQNPAGAFSSKYVVDGWACLSSGPQVINTYQRAAPSAPTGWAHSISSGPATANPSPAASDYFVYAQNIEGWRVARLGWGLAGASPITIGFWVFSVRPGMFSGAVRNAVIDRSYVFTFTINATMAWEYKTVTIPGDVTGTWAKGNTTGLVVSFTFMCGATNTTAANVWTAGNFSSAPGTTNAMQATGDGFGLTGVVILPGIEAPRADRSALIMRPFDQELLTCQRYYDKSYDYADRPGGANLPSGRLMQTAMFPNATYAQNLMTHFKVRKRAQPSVTLYSPVTGAAGKIRNAGSNTDLTATTNSNSEVAVVILVTVAGIAAGETWEVHYTADARL